MHSYEHDPMNKAKTHENKKAKEAPLKTRHNKQQSNVNMAIDSKQ